MGSLETGNYGEALIQADQLLVKKAQTQAALGLLLKVREAQHTESYLITSIFQAG